MQGVSFDIFVSEASGNPPPGYLFVCPEKDLRIGPSSFRLPDYPAYWSLDPEEAIELGFPSIELNTSLLEDSWDADVYAALRQFHQAKGFDPDSQDVARQLGHPLYQLHSVMDPLFAHGKSSSNESFRFIATDMWYKWTTQIPIHKKIIRGQST